MYRSVFRLCVSFGCWLFAFGLFTFFRRGFGGCRTASDRGDREVAVGDGWLCIARQLDVGDFHIVADFQLGNVCFQGFRNVAGWNQKFDRVTHHVERAALLEARETSSPMK